MLMSMSMSRLGSRDTIESACVTVQTLRILDVSSFRGGTKTSGTIDSCRTINAATSSDCCADGMVGNGERAS